MGDATPRFTDQEMALILKRATELQATGEESVYTLEGIQQIAEQVGIDPERVAQAAAAVQAPGITSGQTLFGASAAYRLTRLATGTLQAADHAALIATIHDHLREVGEVTESAGGIVWRAGSSDQITAVAFAPSAQGTVIRIDARHMRWKVVLFLSAGTMTLLTALGGLTVSPELGAGLGLGSFALTFASARLLWNRLARAGQRRLDNLVSALTAQLDRPPGDSSDTR